MGAASAAVLSGPEGSAEGAVPAPQQRKRASLYLIPVLLGPLLMIVSAFFIIPSHWFELRCENVYMLNTGYGTRVHNLDCQVLIYGDSGAMVGVEPEIIQKRTGLTACNVAEFQGMTMVNGTMPLDTFLSNNPRPRYMLFLYAPGNLNVPWSWAAYTVNEAISFRIEHQPGLRTALLLAAHPTQTMAWVEGGLHLALTRLHTPPYPPEVEHMREQSNGWYGLVVGHPRTVCDPKDYSVAPDPQWIQHLRTKYAVNGTTVIVDAVPTPACDPNNAFFAEHLRGYIDNYPLPHMPLSAYTDEGVLHTTHEGAAMLSNLVADQIAARERDRKAAGSALPAGAPANARQAP